MVTSLLSERYRSDFPILDQMVNGKPLVYLDNAASTQRPEKVILELARYYREDHANVHRGIHALSTRATLLYEGARERVRSFLNAESADSIVFTRGTTEAINLVASSWADAYLRPGDTILLTEMEHHANLIPWQVAARRCGATIEYLSVEGPESLIVWDKLEDRLQTGRVRLLACTHLSNTLGCVNPVAEICRKARAHGITTLIDAAQSAGHACLDVREIGCDFLAFSGHKCCGPTGIGVLYAMPGILNQLEPYQFGGEMILNVTYESATWKPAPARFEAGTPNIAGAIGLAKALDYIDLIGRPVIQQNDHLLGEFAFQQLQSVPGIQILGPANGRAGIVTFALPGIHAHDLVAYADQFGIALRGGHHCNQPLMRKLGFRATARASFYIYNTVQEVEFLTSVLQAAVKYFC